MKPQSTGRFEVRLFELKEPWQAYCKKNKLDASEATRQVIKKLLTTEQAKGKETEHQPVATGRVFQTEPVSEGKKRMEVRFTLSELSAIVSRAEDAGFDSPNLWVAAVVRANLTNQPQFGRFEIDVLGESNHQLLAIGRNLNQIAHALNSARGDTRAYDRELVEELALAVKRHVTKVGDLLRASIFRWKLR